ncbi:hypothetical protein [Cognatiluteimonas telluris]|uniref:hypothetical protein n=1 Tax=Cognatiluteimonas telluris TaxID=1104775 RepID=UPI00140CF5A1|nr:hypothetical protein [Lysobacter telluris]
MLLAIVFGKLLGRAASKPSNEELLDSLAIKANKALPMMLDKETRLNPVTAVGGKRMIYRYTLVNYSSDRLTAANIAAIRKQTVNETCANQTKNLLAKNVELEFAYNSNDGVRVLDLVVRPNACIFDPYLGGYSVAP